MTVTVALSGLSLIFFAVCFWRGKLGRVGMVFLALAAAASPLARVVSGWAVVAATNITQIASQIGPGR